MCKVAYKEMEACKEIIDKKYNFKLSIFVEKL
jgi:hypothetical protein